jgi:hypothetical protein
VRLADGIHHGVPHAVYHERTLGVVSKSALDLVARSPAHYRAWVDGAEEEQTAALAFGSAFHCALLEPDRFAAEYVTAPDFGDCRRKSNKEARAAWDEEHASATPLSAKWAEDIHGMIASIRAHPLAGKMLHRGEPELTVAWTDDPTGLRCKARADYYVRELRMVLDIKTTMDARAESFRRDVVRYGYRRQDALYRAGFAAVDAPIEHFVFVVVKRRPARGRDVFVGPNVCCARTRIHETRHLDARRMRPKKRLAGLSGHDPATRHTAMGRLKRRTS